RSFEGDHELANQVAVPGDPELAGPHALVGLPPVVGERPVAFLADVADLDLVVGGLRLVGGADLVSPAKRADRDSFETDLRIVGDPLGERSPIAAADSRVVDLDVAVE